MKQQTCWTILRFFQYDDKLQIKNERLFDEQITDEILESCKNVEVSQNGINYLNSIFNQFKNEQKNKLDEKSLENIFATME